MRALAWLLAAIGFCLGLTLSGCAEPAPDEPAGEGPDLAGRWQVLALQNRHDCPELGSVAPVEPGGLAFQREGDGWRLVPRSGEGVLWTEQAPNVWTRRVATEWDGCLMEAAATWRFDGVGDTRFDSRFEARIDVSGAACRMQASTCTAEYTVTGARQVEAEVRP